MCRDIGIFSDTEDLTGKSFIGREFMQLSEQEQVKALFDDRFSGRVFSRYVAPHWACVCLVPWHLWLVSACE